MRKKILNNLPLIVALAIPVIATAILAIVIYLPGSTINPKYDFLYTSSDSYMTETGVIDGRLQVIDHKDEVAYDEFYYPQESPHYYVYDVSENISNEITVEQAKNLKLIDSTKSPDGYEVGPEEYSVYMFSDSQNSWRIFGNNFSREINIDASTNNDYYSLDFIGWVQE